MAEETSKRNTYGIVVLALGTLLAIFILLAVGPKLIGPLFDSSATGLWGGTWEEMVMIATSVFYLIGYGVGWWRLQLGGAIMILSALIVMIPFLAIQGNLGSLIFGLPELVVGLLYVALDRLKK